MISFADYMEQSLYHPEHGFYTKHAILGRKGHFATSATLGENLGRAVWSWAKAAGLTGKFKHMIEVGPGDGSLAAAILSEAGWLNRKRFRYHLVERSPRLQQTQKEKLGRRIASWQPSLAAALDHCKGRALIFSNELVDAFPCRIFRWQCGQWEELFLEGSNEIWKSTPLPDSTVFFSEQAWPEGQRVEVHTAFQTWLQSWCSHWRAGRMLTIDYGDLVANLYFRRPRGTMRGYFHQQRMEGMEVYQRSGHQDLTADVNFSDLQRWGESLGWRNLRFGSQSQLLMEYGKPARSEVETYLAAVPGPGEAFKFLEQAPPEAK